MALGDLFFEKSKRSLGKLTAKIWNIEYFECNFLLKLLNAESLWFFSDLGTSYFQPKLSSWTAVFCSLVEKDKGYGVELFFFFWLPSHVLTWAAEEIFHEFAKMYQILGNVLDRFWPQSAKFSNWSTQILFRLKSTLVSPNAFILIENVFKPTQSSFPNSWRSLAVINQRIDQMHPWARHPL